MSLQRLKKLIAPPSNPVEPGTPKKWEEVEHQLKTKLPADFKAFIDAYGTGELAGFYIVYNPFASFESMNLLKQLEPVCEEYRGGHDEDPETYPFDVYPEPGGILPWGNDQDSNSYFWLTEGNPDKWTIVFHEVAGEGAVQHRMTFTEYLAGVLEGKVPALASDFPEEEHMTFRPAAKPSTALELVEAVQKRDVARAREALKQNPDLHARFVEGDTPLHYVVEYLPELTESLIDAGADVNEGSDNGSPPLFNADPSVVDLLISRGADLALKRKNGDTAIFAAIMNGNVPLIEALAKHKGVLQQKNKAGQTPLGFAKKRKREDQVELLKKLGAKK